MDFILASTSPTRLKILTSAGINPIVISPEVDELQIIVELTSRQPTPAPAEIVNCLAAAKATHVKELLLENRTNFSGLILGCDSMFWFDNKLRGKPLTPNITQTYWEEYSGKAGELFTGHHLILVKDNLVKQTFSEAAKATVNFSTVTTSELAAYSQKEEPANVAGGFTIDGLGSWFIDSIGGHPTTVLGLSLPILRKMLMKLNLSVDTLWNKDY